MATDSEMKRIEMKVPEKVKTKLVRDSKACGLTITDYVTQLVMGYSPQSFNPDICRLMEAIDSLHFLCTGGETDAAVNDVLLDIRRTLILPQRGG